MFIDIHELEREPREFEEVLQPGRIAFGADVTQTAPMQVSGVAELLDKLHGREIHLSGSLATTVETICDRCLEPTPRPIEIEFDLFYQPMKSIAHEEEIELKPAELEIGFYEGHGLELEEVLKEQVLLTLPVKRVCREDCKGLCPHCGTDLNETTCECVVDEPDPRWDTLRALKTE